jgi:hypothetical protein
LNNQVGTFRGLAPKPSSQVIVRLADGRDVSVKEENIFDYVP